MTEQPVAQRIEVEDALKHLWESSEIGRGATVESLAGSLGWPRDRSAGVLGRLGGLGLAVVVDDGYRLTGEGRTHALQVVRRHRLYETWLARETSTPAGDWHREAHKVEHHMDAAAVDALADRLNNPRFDPHGDPIPTREGDLPLRSLVSLAEWEEGIPAVIEHIEDEPEPLFRMAEGLGLAPGTQLNALRHLTDGMLEVQMVGRRIRIPASVAALVHVTAPGPDDTMPADVMRLTDLPVGGEAVVYGMTSSCMGAERLRLLDLGVVPGTRIRCEFASPFGTPRSYGIRGAMIALRDHQAARILIHPPQAELLEKP